MKTTLTARSAALLATALTCSLCAAQHDNNASASQSGAGNRAYIAQTDNLGGIFAMVVQNGNNNLVGNPDSQSGGVLQYEASNLRMEIRQTGDANRATGTQRSGERTWFILEQTGATNITAVRQDAAFESVTRVRQSGTNNRVDGDAANTLANGFIALQIGADNTVNIFQRRNGFSDSNMDQNGTGNQIVVEQTFADYTQHDMAQYGERNQITALSSESLFTDYTIAQNGTENRATTRTSATVSGGDLVQTGVGNMASTDQQGRSSEYSVTQIGTLNTAALTQTGNMSAETSNLATIRQNGQRLNASLVQTGGGNQGVIAQQ